MNNDLSLFYSGGSGGFLGFHGILLSGIHYADGYDNPIVQTSLQWNAVKKNGTDLWKKSEIDPDNQKTLESDRKNKIFFYCNSKPNVFDYSHIKDSTKILVYTDIETQFMLMELKKAYLVQNKIINWPSDWELFYSDIKDKDWEECEYPNDIKKLPSDIIKRIHNDNYKELDYFGIDSKTDKDVISANVEWYKNNTDVQFKLQDIVKTKFKNVTDALNIPHTEEQKILTEYWLSLHPVEIQQHLME